MNLTQHTVTIPIADYNELMARKTDDQKFTDMKLRLVSRLKLMDIQTFHSGRELLNQLIIELQKPT